MIHVNWLFRLRNKEWMDISPCLLGMLENKKIRAFSICGFAYHVALKPEEQPDAKDERAVAW